MRYYIEGIYLLFMSNPHNQDRSSGRIFSHGFVLLGCSWDSLHPSSPEIAVMYLALQTFLCSELQRAGPLLGMQGGQCGSELLPEPVSGLPSSPALALPGGGCAEQPAALWCRALG